MNFRMARQLVHIEYERVITIVSMDTRVSAQTYTKNENDTSTIYIYCALKITTVQIQRRQRIK